MALRFHPPRGDLKFWSFLWILFGVLGSIYFAVQGQMTMVALTLSIGLLALGICLRVKVCGYLLFGLIVTFCLLAVPLIFRDGGFHWYRLFRTCLSGYFAYLLFRWIREFGDPVENQDPDDA